MTSLDLLRSDLTRRGILKGTGALVISFSAPATLAEAAIAAIAAPKPLDPTQLDSYLAIHRDGSATVFFGKIDGGQGTDVGIAQIVAEELDLPADKVAVVMGDSAKTINQGGASGSFGITWGGKPMRHAAAQARQTLLDLAAKRLDVSADKLTVTDGVVAVLDAPAKKITYGQLVGGKFFNVTMKWNGKIGNDLDVDGGAPLKKPADYKVVGTAPPRRDVKPKVFARPATYVTDIRLPGMLHARVVRPPVAGAEAKSVDESSIRSIPGARAVQKDGYIAVVAPKEWNAIRAAQQLKVDWSQPAPAFADPAQLYDTIRKAPVRKRTVEKQTGSVDQAMQGAAKVVEADYEWPFQSHASMGSACAVAEMKDGVMTVWTGSQKPHYARDGVAALLKLPPEKVRAIWLTGPGSYGRNDAGDAALEAAFLAQATGKPVRIQGMRPEGITWDTKGPASVHHAKAGLDAAGKIIAYQFESKGFSRLDLDSNESDPAYSLIGQQWGVALKPLDSFGTPDEAYDIPNQLKAWETIAPMLDRVSPLRTSHLRDPVGPQIHFASESFIDELALAAKTDPVEFRLRHLSGRDAAAVKAAAEKFGWTTRVSGPSSDSKADVVTGRGIAYAKRLGTIVVVAAEVEVDRRSGKVRTKRFAVAHDCGCVVNPALLHNTIEGNIVQATSRSLWEEVRFDKQKVTSVDWLTYPILDITEAPEKVDIVLLDHPEIPPTGAGEPSSRPVAGAIANAIFDATGVRIRRAPFRPENLKGSFA
ncbi:MAG TPA: molybdopterin cofactor-binding domain-containing protein [Stellaceae bacterium]